MNLQNVLASISLDVSDFELGSKRAEEAFTSAMGRMKFSALDFQRGVEGVTEKLLGAFEELLTPIGAVGAALSVAFSIGVQAADRMDEALSRVRGTTGTAGEALEDMGRSTVAVLATVPESIEKVTEAMGSLHQRTGETGPALEALTKTVVDLARVTGSDLHSTVVAVGQLFNNWQISTDNQTTALNTLLTASQQSGIGMEQLLSMLTRFGAPMQEFGFDLEHGAALLGALNEAGIPPQRTLMGLQSAMNNLTKMGIEPGIDSWNSIIKLIKEAPNTMAATQIATDLLGGAGAKLATAFRSGAIDVDAFLQKMREHPDTVSAAAKATAGLSEAWGVLTNVVQTSLAPIGVDFVKALTNAIKGITDFILNLTDAKAAHGFWVQALIDGSASAATAVRNLATPLADMVTAFNAVGTSVTNLFITLAPLSGVGSVLSFVFGNIAKAIKEVIDAMGFVAKAISLGIDYIKDYILIQQSAIDITIRFGKALLDAVPYANQLAASMVSLTEKVWDYVKAQAKRAGEAIAPTNQNEKKALDELTVSTAALARTTTAYFSVTPTFTEQMNNSVAAAKRQKDAQGELNQQLIMMEGTIGPLKTAITAMNTALEPSRLQHQLLAGNVERLTNAYNAAIEAFLAGKISAEDLAMSLSRLREAQFAQDPSKALKNQQDLWTMTQGTVNGNIDKIIANINKLAASEAGVMANLSGIRPLPAGHGDVNMGDVPEIADRFQSLQDLADKTFPEVLFQVKQLGDQGLADLTERIVEMDVATKAADAAWLSYNIAITKSHDAMEVAAEQSIILGPSQEALAKALGMTNEQFAKMHGGANAMAVVFERLKDALPPSVFEAAKRSIEELQQVFEQLGIKGPTVVESEVVRLTLAFDKLVSKADVSAGTIVAGFDKMVSGIASAAGGLSNVTDDQWDAIVAAAKDAYNRIVEIEGEYSQKAIDMHKKLEDLIIDGQNRMQANGSSQAALTAKSFHDSMQKIINDAGGMANLSAERWDDLQRRANIAYEEIVQSAGRNSQAAYRAWGDQLQLQIGRQAEAGQQITLAQEIQLQQQERNVINSTTGMTKSYQDFSNAVSGIMNTFAGDMAKILFGDSKDSLKDKTISMLKSLGEAMAVQMLKPWTDALASFLTHTLFPFVKTFQDTITGQLGQAGGAVNLGFGRGGGGGSIPGVGSVQGPVQQIGTGVFDENGIEVMQEIPLGGGASGAAGGAGGLGGAAGSLGSIMGIVGAVGSIGTMISSIIGNFQMAKQEKTMNAIEESTRRLDIVTEQSIVPAVTALWGIGNDIKAELQDMSRGIDKHGGGGTVGITPSTVTAGDVSIVAAVQHLEAFLSPMYVTLLNIDNVLVAGFGTLLKAFGSDLVNQFGALVVAINKALGTGQPTPQSTAQRELTNAEKEYDKAVKGLAKTVADDNTALEKLEAKLPAVQKAYDDVIAANGKLVQNVHDQGDDVTQAQHKVDKAQTDYDTAVGKFGEGSPQAIAKHDILIQRQDDLATQTRQLTDAQTALTTATGKAKKALDDLLDEIQKAKDKIPVDTAAGQKDVKDAQVALDKAQEKADATGTYAALLPLVQAARDAREALADWTQKLEQAQKDSENAVLTYTKAVSDASNNLARAKTAYVDAVEKFGEGSTEAKTALQNVAAATSELTDAQNILTKAQQDAATSLGALSIGAANAKHEVDVADYNVHAGSAEADKLMLMRQGVTIPPEFQDTIDHLYTSTLTLEAYALSLKEAADAGGPGSAAFIAWKTAFDQFQGMETKYSTAVENIRTGRHIDYTTAPSEETQAQLRERGIKMNIIPVGGKKMEPNVIPEPTTIQDALNRILKQLTNGPVPVTMASPGTETMHYPSIITPVGHGVGLGGVPPIPTGSQDIVNAVGKSTNALIALLPLVDINTNGFQVVATSIGDTNALLKDIKGTMRTPATITINITQQPDQDGVAIGNAVADTLRTRGVLI